MNSFELKRRLLGDGRSVLAALYVRTKIGVVRRTVPVRDRSLSFLSAPAWFEPGGEGMSADGRYEAPFFDALIDDVGRTKKPVYFDIGANVGFDALVVDLFAPCEQHLFEPDPIALYFLHRNCHQLAHRLETTPVGEKDGAATLTLDTYCARTGVVPTQVKMDIEGFEWSALRGMTATLERAHPSIFIEFHERIMREILGLDAARVDWCFDHLRGLGYRILFNDHHRALERDSSRQFDFTWSEIRPSLPHYAVMACHPAGPSSS